MTDLEGRFDHLEQRVERLEALLRQVLARLPRGALAETPPIRAAPPEIDAPPPRAAPSFHPSRDADLVGTALKEPRFDLEQWVGRRGLLVVGVVALLGTGALFLDYAFEHHWIPPLVRSISSIAAGIACAAWGHRLIARDLRRYGGPIVGAGGGLIYLGIWAAAGPFALIDRHSGIILLAVAGTVFTILAQRYEIEGLATSAVLGAFAAPIVLPTPVPDPQLFLGYVEVIGIGAGIVAYAMSWRRTLVIAALGYILLAALVLTFDDSVALVHPVGLSFLVVGALVGSEVSRRRPWWEARMIMAFGAWVLMTAAMPDAKDSTDGVRWLAIAAMAVICGTLFAHLRATDAFGEGRHDQLAEPVLYLTTPVALTVFVLAFTPALLLDRTALVPLVVAGPYLADGWMHRRGHALMVGLGFLAWAVAIQFDPVGIAVGWAALGAAAAGGYAVARHPRLQESAVILFTLGAVALFVDALPSRVSHGDAFSDPWALGLWTVLAAGGLAIWWWRAYVEKEARPRTALWWVEGAALLMGISVNILEHFADRPGAGLAGNLALSVWWLVFAAAVVGIGFRREAKAVRSAGLAVAVVATLKVLLYDLSELEALYRIGAFFALAAIALGVAYAYHRSDASRSSAA